MLYEDDFPTNEDTERGAMARRPRLDPADAWAAECDARREALARDLFVADAQARGLTVDRAKQRAEACFAAADAFLAVARRDAGERRG